MVEERQIPELVITSEADAIEAIQVLQAAVAEEADYMVRFDGFPRVELRYEGEDFKSSIPYRLFPPLVEFQKALYHLYAQTRYGDPKKPLTKDEKEALEIVVLVGDGSSDLLIDLERVLQALSNLREKMTGPQFVTITIAASVLFTAHLGWKNWLNHLTDVEQIHSQEALSEQETERLKIVTGALSGSSVRNEADKAADVLWRGVLNQVRENDKVSVGEAPSIDGETAHEIAKKPRMVAVVERYDAVYRVFTLDSSADHEYKVRLHRVSDGLTFSATTESLSMADQKAIAAAVRDRSHVDLKINAKVLRGKIAAAWITGVNEASEQAVQVE